MQVRVLPGAYGHLYMEERDKIYGTDELRRFFGVSKKTIWAWCKRGKLPAFKIGKDWKVRVSDLNRIINQKVNAHREQDKTLF